MTTRTPFRDELTPLSPEALDALRDGTNLQLFLAVHDGPRTLDDLVAETGLTYADARERLGVLFVAGLVAPEAGIVPTVYRPVHPHVHDLDRPVEERVALRRALLDAVADVVRTGRRALAKDPERAMAGVTMVTLPDDEETMLKAVAVMAEAEKKLRALARDGEDGPRARVVLFLASQ